MLYAHILPCARHLSSSPSPPRNVKPNSPNESAFQVCFQDTTPVQNVAEARVLAEFPDPDVYGQKIARRKSTPQKSSWISSGIFQWIVSGIFQHHFTCQLFFQRIVTCPVDVYW